MKIIKPLTLGLLHQPYRYRGQHRLSIAALGFFALGRSDERFLVENLQWPRVLPQLPAGQPLDHVLPKARPEAVVIGAAHSPKPVESMMVRVQCGTIDKQLRVIGDRHWHRRLWPTVCIDAPVPFVKMPLTLERAYGGVGHENPLGRGYLPRFPWLRCQHGQLPNVEYPDQPVAPGRRVQPFAGLSPQQLAHAVSKRKNSGTYDARWLKEDFPGLPRDFDFSMYNLAPPDQQMSAPLRGGEAYRLEGLNAAGTPVAGSLPAMRVQAFLLGKGQAIASVEPVSLRCDTVWFFPEVGVGLMIYRGEQVVTDSDALDVSTLMLAYDTLSSPRSNDHFREVLSLRLDPATAALHAFNESQLAPQRSALAQAERERAKEAQRRQVQMRKQAALDETMAEFWSRSGLRKPGNYQPPRAERPTLPTVTADELAEGDFDMVELHAAAMALAGSAKRESEAKLATLPGRLPSSPKTVAKPIEQQVAEALARASHMAPDLAHATSTSDVMPPDLATALTQAEQMEPGIVDPARVRQARAALNGIPALQRAARTAAPTPTTLDAPPPAAVAIALGKQLLALHVGGQPLAGRDFAGADLRNADLRGADLRQVQLERSDLRGACLIGANLSGAALTAARMDGADLSDARLDDANLCGTSAVGATFTGASMNRIRAFDASWIGAALRGVQLDDALMMRIDLSNACLDDSTLSRTVLMNAIAKCSRWVGSRWNMCVAPSADFGQACFDGASLLRCVLMDAQMPRSSWKGATLKTVYAGGKSDWSGSQMGLLQATKCGWRGSTLRDACLDGAVLNSCDFGDADLSGTRLRGAQLYRSLFLRTTLHDVDATGASFFQAMCRKADFSSADLRGAILVQADIAEASMTGAKTERARTSPSPRLP